uniref:Bm1390 n=1 Tax=Brugia malayi TaxID=6279 RepID=A0A1I9G6T9_BRUMA|nr:Bm1390 [Brugia malayi]
MPEFILTVLFGDKRETILTTTVVVLVGVGRGVDVTWCDVISFLLLEEILWNVLETHCYIRFYNTDIYAYIISYSLI